MSKARLTVGGASIGIALEPGSPLEIPIGRAGREWFIDSLQIDLAGVVRLAGWSASSLKLEQSPEIYANGEQLSAVQEFRYPRLDLARSRGDNCLQSGYAIEYLVPDHLLHKPVELRIDLDGSPISAGPYIFINAHYRSLLATDQVFHRENIYGSGLPNSSVHPDIVTLAGRLPAPILDFGCGRGALLIALQELGRDVYGLELESDMFRELIPAELKKFITFYAGEFPVRFADRQFKSVVCSEVLEHIPDYQSAVAEIARITSETALFTVPNASAIPLGFRHGAVPWHLLEATHVNFFTQQSLHAVLAPHFSRVEFGRVGSSRFNDSPYFVSLVAFCSK